ncbi:siderophore-interacting protein [Duganella levis]|uniref:Siderophore-interacting protein n=1 Tax=Duganella levis TaxID=2692169 RepID=A0ABW9W143_9BURK|nr:siderophore-interacting protein [Duganella levis]MYN27507.1 siderophore-interacting protein [Duganella levis]
MDNTFPTRRAGLFESAVQKLFTRPARVLEIENLGPYRLVTLGGDALRNAAWHAGDKIQIQLGGWVQRTYTPLDWDAEAGRLRILIYLHADGPGTQWARTLRQGDSCVVFGPRKSVRLAEPQPALIFVGDETSAGLAAALSPAQILLEMNAPADSAEVLAMLGLQHAQVCARHGDDAHIAELGNLLLAMLAGQPSAAIVLTGKASTIQHLTRLLRRQPGPAAQRHSKAYWATGKSGMD